MKKLVCLLILFSTFTASAGVIVLDDDTDRDTVAGPGVTTVNMSSHDNGGWGSGAVYFNQTNAYNGSGDLFNNDTPGAGASATYTLDAGMGVLPGAPHNVYVTWQQGGQWNCGPATYTVSDGLGGVVVDQTLAVAADLMVYDAFNDVDQKFQLLGQITEDGDGVITITLSNDGSTFFVADAVAVEFVNEPILTYPLNSDSPTGWDLTLEWLAPPTFTPGGYNIYLDPNELEVSNRNPLTKINSVLDTDPNYDVTNLTHGETYYWLVEARQDPVTTPPTDPNWIASGVATFTTMPDEPIITTHPESVTVAATTEVTLTVEAINATGYQWYADGVLMVGKTSPTLTLTGVLKAQEGFYHCEVSNASDTVISDKARLMIQRRVALWTFEDTINSVVVTDEDAFTGAYVDPNDLTSAGPQYDNSDPSPQGGKALALAGDTTESEGNDFGEYVEVSDPNFFNFYPQGVTASSWVKITGPGTTGWGAIACKQDRPSNGWVLQKNSASGVFTMRPAGDLQGDTNLDTVNEDLGNTWHLVTGTCDGETLRVYIDGSLENEASAPTMAPHSVPVLIGAETPTGFSPLEGLIDNVEIYNYALSRVDVAVLYTSQVPGATVCTEDLANIEFDFNGDCIQDIKDLSLLAAQWLDCYIVPTCLPSP